MTEIQTPAANSPANPQATMRSLRRRLFSSHLLVIFVSLGVLIVGLVLFASLLQLLDAKVQLNRGGDGGGGPLGLLFGLAAAALASSWVSWRVSTRLTRPLQEIGAATRDLAAGRYTTRVPNSDTAELDALADDVNQLAHDLQTTEQRRLRLIGDVAHELRNPLSTIEGTMEALLDGVVEAEPDTYARIGREAARLRRLADDLSSLSKAGEPGAITTEPVNVTAIVSDVVAQLEPQAAAKGLELKLEQSAVPSVLGDRDRLTQVFMNVVGNAVQYTDDGGVTVSVTADDLAIHVTVSDTGRGLAEADLTRVFERFHRVDAHFSDGTGVGLAIAKLIVEAHSGRMSVWSDGVGSGSSFVVELPLL